MFSDDLGTSRETCHDCRVRKNAQNYPPAFQLRQSNSLCPIIIGKLPKPIDRIFSNQIQMMM